MAALSPLPIDTEGIRSPVIDEEAEGGPWWASPGYGEGPWFFFITPPSRRDGTDEGGTVVAFHIDPLKHSSVEIHRVPVPRPFQLYRLLNPLPRPGGGHNLLIQNQGNSRGTIHIVDPSSSSWKSLSSFPGCVQYSRTARSIFKAVTRNHGVTPGTPVVAITRPNRQLVWTTAGTSSAQWRSLQNHCLRGDLAMFFSDVIWSGTSFWALRPGDSEVISFDFDFACGGGGSMKVQEMRLDLTPQFKRVDTKALSGWKPIIHALFVDAPSGLFIVRWAKLMKKGEEEAEGQLDVHKLVVVKGDKKRWRPVTSLDGCSFFLGSNNSIALSPADFPGLRSNCIYLPFHGRYPLHDITEDWRDIPCLEDLPVNWIYNLDDHSWEPCNADGIDAFIHCPFAWVMPQYTMTGKGIRLTSKGTRTLPLSVHENPEISSSATPVLKADCVDGTKIFLCSFDDAKLATDTEINMRENISITQPSGAE